MASIFTTRLRQVGMLALGVTLFALVAACTPTSPATTPGAGTPGTQAPTGIGPGTSGSGPTAPSTGNVTPATQATATAAAPTPTPTPTPIPKAVYASTGSGFAAIDPQTGRVMNTTSTSFDVRDVAISPDGKLAYLVVGTPKLAALPSPVATRSTTATPRAGTATPGEAAGTPTAGLDTATPTPSGQSAGPAGLVAIYDLTTRSQVGQITVGNDPWAIVLSRDGKLAYVSNLGDDTVSVIDTSARNVVTTLDVGTQPTGLAIFGQAPVTTGGTSGTIAPGARGTPTVGTPTTSTTPAAGTPTAASGTPTTSRGTPSPTAGGVAGLLYVANYGSNDVSVVDLSNGKVLAKVSVGTNPLQVADDPANNRVFVANVGSSDLSVIGVATNQVDSRVRLDGKPSSVAVSDDGRLVYVSLMAPTNSIQIVDPALLAAGGAPAGTATPATAIGAATPTPGSAAANPGAIAVSRIPVGDNPSDVVFSVPATHAFVANQGEGTVSVIDTSTRSVIATAQVGGQPSALDYSAGGSTTPTAVTTPVATAPATTGLPTPTAATSSTAGVGTPTPTP